MKRIAPLNKNNPARNPTRECGVYQANTNQRLGETHSRTCIYRGPLYIQRCCRPSRRQTTAVSQHPFSIPQFTSLHHTSLNPTNAFCLAPLETRPATLARQCAEGWSKHIPTFTHSNIFCQFKKIVYLCSLK